MRIFSATLGLWSMSSTRRPRWPATAAQNSPAAPAPMTMASQSVWSLAKRSAFPGEGEGQLPQEAPGHVVAQHAVAFGPGLRAVDGGAEQVVQEGVVGR